MAFALAEHAHRASTSKTRMQKGVTMRTILLVILILLLLGALPLWPYSAGWGYYPGGGIGLILLVLIILIVLGRV